jgi:hypothetical protein
LTAIYSFVAISWGHVSVVGENTNNGKHTEDQHWLQFKFDANVGVPTNVGCLVIILVGADANNGLSLCW